MDGVAARAQMGSVMCGVLTLALLGGNAIACERADRSAEYLFYQPVSRGKILVSKLLLPGLALLVIWGLNLAVLAICISHQSRAPDTMLGYVPFFIATCCAFSVGWGLSAVQNSPTYAVATGIAAPIVVVWLIAMVNWMLGFPYSTWTVMLAYVAITASLTMFSFVGGTWYYLRRVEP